MKNNNNEFKKVETNWQPLRKSTGDTGKLYGSNDTPRTRQSKTPNQKDKQKSKQKWYMYERT